MSLKELRIKPPTRGGLPSLVVGERLRLLKVWCDHVYGPYMEAYPKKRKHRPKWLLQQFLLMGYCTLGQAIAISGRNGHYIAQRCTHIYLPYGAQRFYCIDEAMNLKDLLIQETVDAIKLEEPKQDVKAKRFVDQLGEAATKEYLRRTQKVRLNINAAKLGMRFGAKNASKMTGIRTQVVNKYINLLKLEGEAELLAKLAAPKRIDIPAIKVSKYNSIKFTKGNLKHWGPVIIE